MRMFVNTSCHMPRITVNYFLLSISLSFFPSLSLTYVTMISKAIETRDLEDEEEWDEDSEKKPSAESNNSVDASSSTLDKKE